MQKLVRYNLKNIFILVKHTGQDILTLNAPSNVRNSTS